MFETPDCPSKAEMENNTVSILIQNELSTERLHFGIKILMNKNLHLKDLFLNE